MSSIQFVQISPHAHHDDDLKRNIQPGDIVLYHSTNFNGKYAKYAFVRDVRPEDNKISLTMGNGIGGSHPLNDVSFVKTTPEHLGMWEREVEFLKEYAPESKSLISNQPPHVRAAAKKKATMGENKQYYGIISPPPLIPPPPSRKPLPPPIPPPPSRKPLPPPPPPPSRKPLWYNRFPSAGASSRTVPPAGGGLQS